MCSSMMSFLRGSGSSVSTATVRLPCFGRPVTRMMSPSPSVSTSCPGCTASEHAANRDCWACPTYSTASCLPRPAATAQRSASRAARGPHLVQQRHAVEKPHHVALIVVFVDVLEVGIQRVVVEIEIGVGIRCPLPRIGDRQIFRIEHLRLGCLWPRSLRWESTASSRSHSCRSRRSAFPWARF